MLPDIPFWWILGAAATLGALWVVRVFGAALSTEMFVRIMQKLVREKNLSRAIKLSSAAGDAPLAIATKAALLASVSREEETSRPAGYRGSRPVSIDSVRGRIRARYDVAFSQSAAPLQNSFLLALAALPLFIVTSYMALLQPELDWKIIGAAGGGFLFWVYVGWSHLKILFSRNAGFEALWPSFEAVYHDRNAINMDDKPVYRGTDLSTTTPATTEVKDRRITFEILEPGKPLRTQAVKQEVIKIGSFVTSHIQLSSPGVSSVHAVIEIADGKATIIDLSAKVTTTVNLENVTKRELADGDVIGIGEAELVVRFRESDAASF